MKFEKIKRAIDSGLFIKDMCSIELPPSMSDIQKHSKSLPFPLSSAHIALLQEWGGSGLDEIRINPLDRVKSDGSYITFANDYNGFVFKYNRLGNVYAQDTDGGDVSQLADSIEDFINNVFLGDKCVEFYGVEWLEDLKKHNLV